MSIAEATQEVVDAIKGVSGLQVIPFSGSVELDPPAVVMGAPSFDAMAYGRGFFTNARLLVHLIVPADELALERLWEFLPLVTEAIDSNSDGKCTRAMPTSFPAGGSGGLPSYEITVEVPL
jgi:hypothetical protein